MPKMSGAKRARKEEQRHLVELTDGTVVYMNRDEAEAWSDDFSCPITFELLHDPVRMQDGKLYEREAIAEHIARTQINGQVKSPLTNVMISVEYEPDEGMRSTIRRLVQGGVLIGEKAEAWKSRETNANMVAALRVDAAKGNAVSMARIGFSYRDGKRGLRTDPAEAFKWFMKAANLNYGPAAGAAGIAYINGSGVNRDAMRGVCMITRAAMLGSEHACGVLGWLNECGLHGLSKSEEDARYWYGHMQTGSLCKDADPWYRERATLWIAKHGAESG